MSDVDNPLSKLELDYWYKVLMAVGFFVFLLSGLGLLSAFPLAPTVCISSGMFFIGLGEWINHPLQEKLMEATQYFPAGKITGYPRNNRFSGVFFVFIGLVIIFYGIYKLELFIV